MLKISLSFCLFFCLSLFPLIGLTDNGCKAVDENEIALSGPEGSCFRFRAVSIGEGEGPFIQKRFVMGDPTEGFRAHPTAVVIGGNFSKELSSGSQEWFYYLGSHEVTEGQYYAVMGIPEGKSKDVLNSKLPITNVSYFDIMNFINKLNAWSYKNLLNKGLPTQRSVPAFFRLPTEAEWEFAARGGSKSGAELFSSQTPYSENLAAYEWFAGPSSSHNKVQEVAKLKPNQLGLYDMLGNVSEITSNNYQLEYYQGRIGGITARGGHFFTNEDDMRASMRTEEPLYIGNVKSGMKENAKATMGFRLAMGIPVLGDRNSISELEDAWDNYRNTKGAELPAAMSTAPTTQQTDVKLHDAKVYIAKIKEQLTKAGISSVAMQDLGFLEAALVDADLIRKQAEEELADAMVSIASHLSAISLNENKKLIILKGLIDRNKADNNAVQSERLNARLEEINKNISDSFAKYLTTMEQLSKINTISVEKAFVKNLHKLQALNISEELKASEIVKTHYADLMKNKKADAQKWKQSFIGDTEQKQ